MKLMQNEVSYGIEVGKNNPFIKGIACIIAGVALGLPMIVILLIKWGIISMTESQLIIAIAMYSGLLTIGIITSMTVPMFVQYAKSIKITGEVSSFDTREIITKRKQSYPVVEYEYNGHIYQKSMSPSFVSTTEGDEVQLLVNRKRPEKAVSQKRMNISIVDAILTLFLPAIMIPFFLFFCLPTFFIAANSEKKTGRIIELTTGGKQQFSPIVKYSYEGRTWESELSSWSSTRPTIGAPVTLKINPKNPQKIISSGEIIFSIFMTVIFTAMGVLICSIGFFANDGSSTPVTIDDSSGIFFIIWGGFVLFWLLLGIIVCAVVKKRKELQDLKETGTRTPCTIVDVSVNTSILVNGMHPVKITCSAYGTMYTVKTKVYPEKCEYRAGNTIDLYFDPTNEKRFYADI